MKKIQKILGESLNLSTQKIFREAGFKPNDVLEIRITKNKIEIEKIGEMKIIKGESNEDD
jgi:hypothetical protein